MDSNGHGMGWLGRPTPPQRIDALAGNAAVARAIEIAAVTDGPVIIAPAPALVDNPSAIVEASAWHDAAAFLDGLETITIGHIGQVLAYRYQPQPASATAWATLAASLDRLSQVLDRLDPFETKGGPYA